MNKLKINNNRLLFPKGIQLRFLQKVKTALNYNNFQLAKYCKVSERTIRDWMREKYTLPEKIAIVLSNKSKINIPDNYKTLPAYWSAIKNARLGGMATFNKYGSLAERYPDKRLANWRKWWNDKGKYAVEESFKQREVVKPKKSANLAELFGIIMGDGGITSYQVVITLNKTDDKEYIKYVVELIKKLFLIEPSQRVRDAVVMISISRKQLVNFLIEFGLKEGSKIRQQIDIPAWIKNNNNFAKTCIRGLVDTDGSVYTHKYKVKGKNYSYKKLCFVSRSKPLISSVKLILEKLQFHPKIDYRGDLRIYQKKEICRYFDVIGSSNPKHIRRYKMIG